MAKQISTVIFFDKIRQNFILSCMKDFNLKLNGAYNFFSKVCYTSNDNFAGIGRIKV